MRIMIFFMAMMLTSLNVAADESWVLALDKDQLQIFTKTVPDSPFLAVKGVVKINATLEQVAASLGSDNECAKWRKMCKSTRVLARPGENERIVRMVIDLPWPLADRDAVNRIITERCGETGRVTLLIKSEPELYPDDDYIRAVSDGRFELSPISENATQFTFVMHTDMGGDLPADRINKRMPEATAEDLNRLRMLAEAR